MMRKSWVVVVIALMLFTACRSGSGVEVTSTPSLPGEETESEVCEPNEDCSDESESNLVEEESEAVEEPTAQPTVEPTIEPTKKPDDSDVSEEIVSPIENPLAERESDWAMGPEDALFTLVEYSDYLCPHCATVAPQVMDILAAFPEDIRFIYRHFPLTSQEGSANHLAVQAAEAAGLQDRFFDYHNLLFEKQSEWKAVATIEEMRSMFIEYAAALGLNKEQFTRDIDSPELAAKAVEAYQGALSIGLQGTPSFFLNGSSFNPGAFSAPIEQWETFIEGQKAILTLPKYERPPMTIDTEKEYQATVETEKGDIVIELFPKNTPVTVNNFIFLANEGFYDGVTFHRVIADFMAQTGDPSGTGMGGPGYMFEDEIDPELTFDGPGVVAMANSGADTNGSQWFITFVATPHLDGQHTIFGKVVEGMDVVMSLTLRDPNASPDFDGDKILSVTIEEK
ncbi:MAG: peptidylprolyl isomerase [Anaerolineales bacterium]|nr:peptidylprolyl isomerase [Anaerolineales bacterium]